MQDKEITIVQAMDVLCKRLREDEDYWDTWQANIAMAIHDEYYSHGKSNLDGETLHKVFNDGADRFLKQLIGKTEKDGN